MLLTTDEIELVKTCHACPEQYDVFPRQTNWIS